jgi:hypothetical protein
VGIHREYARLTPAELQRALADPAWAEEHIDALAEAWVDDDAEPEDARFFSVDKSWPGIELVLASAGLPDEFLHGTDELRTIEEWDYGPPTYLRPEQVTAVAERLSALSVADLVDGIDPEFVRSQDLYQVGDWTDDDRAYVTLHAQHLQRFYASVAKAGDAVVVMLT